MFIAYAACLGFPQATAIVVRVGRRLAPLWVSLMLGMGVPAGAEGPPELQVVGMTLVAHRESGSSLSLRARVGRFRPESELAELEDVVAVVTYADERKSLEMTCDRAELDVSNNNFLAEGNVHGVTGDGQRYSAPWVKYEHDKGVLFSDASVVMVDETGTFRGDGFRFHLEEGLFRLLGNVSVVQTP